MRNFGRTSPVPLRHRQIDRLSLRDWIRDQIEAGQPTPTDAEIMERFGFEHPEQARTLLADLSDQGLITIFGTGADREILLGRVRPSQRAAAPRPVPSVVRPETKPTSAKAGAERLASILAGVAPKKEAAPAAAKAVPAPAKPGAVEKPKSAAKPQPALPAATPSADQPARKPKLRADMTAAAIRNGIPIDTFIGMLLERGFKSFSFDERTQKELLA
jgi:hypothetical protein